MLGGRQHSHQCGDVAETRPGILGCLSGVGVLGMSGFREVAYRHCIVFGGVGLTSLLASYVGSILWSWVKITLRKEISSISVLTFSCI